MLADSPHSSSMVKFFRLIFWLTGKIQSQFGEHLGVYMGQDHTGVSLAVSQPGQGIDGLGGIFVHGGADRERNQDLVHMQTWIMIAQIAAAGCSVLSATARAAATTGRFSVEICMEFIRSSC